ncbi:hypothetical protein M0804_004542 [Polistes exclamans]|nr:hypothetical protein M0804_004542 [Polistes exclamans]
MAEDQFRFSRRYICNVLERERRKLWDGVGGGGISGLLNKPRKAQMGLASRIGHKAYKATRTSNGDC